MIKMHCCGRSAIHTRTLQRCTIHHWQESRKAKLQNFARQLLALNAKDVHWYISWSDSVSTKQIITQKKAAPLYCIKLNVTLEEISVDFMDHTWIKRTHCCPAVMMSNQKIHLLPTLLSNVELCRIIRDHVWNYMHTRCITSDRETTVYITSQHLNETLSWNKNMSTDITTNHGKWKIAPADEAF